MEKSKSEPYNVAQLYKEVWEAEFNDKFIILPMHLKWAKDLVGIPYDIITDRAKQHCRDLWHRQHCKGSLMCFVKNFNSFVDTTISTKPKIAVTVFCDHCQVDIEQTKYQSHLEECKGFKELPMNDDALKQIIGGNFGRW